MIYSIHNNIPARRHANNRVNPQTITRAAEDSEFSEVVECEFEAVDSESDDEGEVPQVIPSK